MLDGMSDSIQRSRIENLHSREVDRQSPTGLIFVQEVHPSRGIGWWLVLLVNYAIIGNGSNMRWS